MLAASLPGHPRAGPPQISSQLQRPVLPAEACLRVSCDSSSGIFSSCSFFFFLVAWHPDKLLDHPLGLGSVMSVSWVWINPNGGPPTKSVTSAPENCLGHEHRERLRNCHNPEEPKEIRGLYRTWCPGQDLGQKKDVRGQTKEI